MGIGNDSFLSVAGGYARFVVSFPAKMIARVRAFLLIIVSVHAAKNFDSRNVVFTIIGQSEPYHSSVASRLKLDIENQVNELEGREAITHITHEDFSVPGAWTVIPLFRPLFTKYKGSDVRWVLFLEPHTAVRCGKLFEALAAADKQKDVMWVGYPLSDDEPTIIHHFTHFEELEDVGGFLYPNFASGFAMKMGLLESVLDKMESGTVEIDADFAIDPAFELARLIYGSRESPGPLLTRDLSFCVVSMDNCATYPRQFDTCGSVVEDSIFFAVKTWSAFHSTRARALKKTWGRHVTHLHFFSDQNDPSLPATNIGLPNSKTGHCMKTIAILKEVVRRVQTMPQIKWIFLADDDTILGVQRLSEVLSCYRGGGDVTVLGERYGYGYGKKDAIHKGYDYITGGGGTALSVGAAKLLSQCACASLSAPDDMTLGACATHRLHVPLTHSPLFHQARPQDYPREVLARDRPISFHRHSTPDPLKVYATWFQHDDLALRIRDEL
ncbi:beta-1,3-glucosyltransferase isoform X3 [Pieris brassicae]|nr:beta-1,3-glucosyltransferase isoform X3 [Pieris brassicae]XP_045533352.1 beta-1,3-glucosyltransferase isoform X3 [Pieris brassicae]XP_045533353.1 beta-1,3-glucosyltransferase isoform X3 [Pieris brassicae]